MTVLKPPQLIALAIVAVIAILVGLFLANFELTMEKQKSPPAEIARYDSYLALERLFTKTGRSVTRISEDEYWLLAETDLIITDQALLDNESSDDFLNQLLDWLNHGGKLVLFLDAEPEVSEFSYLLLNELQVKAAFLGKTDEVQLVTGNLKTSSGGNFSVEWDKSLKLEYPLDIPPLSQGTINNQTCWLQIPLGKGWVAISAYGHFWQNDHLGTADNAAMISSLMVSDQAVKNIGLLRSWQPKPAVTWPAAWIALILPALVFLFILIWASIPRLGPAIVIRQNQRRSLAERFAADGLFLWRRTDPGILETRVRNSFKQRLAKAFKENHPDILASRLEHLTGTKAVVWLPIISADPSTTLDAEAFRNLMNLLETTRRRL